MIVRAVVVFHTLYFYLLLGDGKPPMPSILPHDSVGSEARFYFTCTAENIDNGTGRYKNKSKINHYITHTPCFEARIQCKILRIELRRL